uniref:Uncharacterized protein n=1 Tax=Rhizophora mucronata TaxID=61149 RepID=A0A2P2NLJ6_RHIMU
MCKSDLGNKFPTGEIVLDQGKDQTKEEITET